MSFFFFCYFANWQCANTIPFVKMQYVIQILNVKSVLDIYQFEIDFPTKAVNL